MNCANHVSEKCSIFGVNEPCGSGRLAKGVLSGIAVSRIRTPAVSALVVPLWMVGEQWSVRCLDSTTRADITPGSAPAVPTVYLPWEDKPL